MVTKKKTNPTQIILAIILVIGMLSGFGLVFAVDYYQDTNGNTESLYITDSNYKTSTGMLETGTFPPYTLGNSYVYRDWAWSVGEIIVYPKTAVYLGNNSWSMAINGSTASPSTNNAMFSIDLPNLPSWLIETVNISLKISTTDDDLFIYGFFIYGESNVFTFPGIVAHVNNIDTFQTSSPNGYYNRTIDLPLAKSVEIYDKAQEKSDMCFVLEVDDKNNDGFAPITITYTIEFTGEKISGWSTIDSITWALAGASIIGFAVTIMATDQFDIGGYIKDLPKRKRKGRGK